MTEGPGPWQLGVDLISLSKSDQRVEDGNSEVPDKIIVVLTGPGPEVSDTTTYLSSIFGQGVSRSVRKVPEVHKYGVTTV